MTTITIQQSDDYFIHVTFRPVDVLPGQFALTIESQWLGADDPNSRQVKYATIINEDAALKLANGIIQEVTLDHVG